MFRLSVATLTRAWNPPSGDDSYDQYQVSGQNLVGENSIIVVRC
ncbi:MAG: hypothetical protein O2983_08170 [Planctomycetota bacterium]|nr:hypothetical protein [Planctomycetota bacterium]MDA1159571.1 hypothetical protein [Planctomycetota bacterium]